MPRPLSRIVLVAVCLAALAGCMEYGRRVVSLQPEITGDVWQIRKPGVVVSEPKPEGLAGEKVAAANSFYRVAKTDTLVSLAQKFYGDRRYARDIYELNRDTITRAGGLKRGLVILLPEIDRNRDGLSATARP